MIETIVHETEKKNQNKKGNGKGSLSFQVPISFMDWQH